MSTFTEKYTSAEREELGYLMGQVGWEYWGEKNIARWEGIVLRLYGIIMDAGERQLAQVRKADDDDYEDHFSTFAE